MDMFRATPSRLKHWHHECRLNHSHGEGAHVQHCQHYRLADGCSQKYSFSMHRWRIDAAIILRKACLCGPAPSSGVHASRLRLFSAQLAVGIHARSAPVPRTTARAAASQTSRPAVGSVSKHTCETAMRLLWMMSWYWIRPRADACAQRHDRCSRCSVMPKALLHLELAQLI